MTKISNLPLEIQILAKQNQTDYAILYKKDLNNLSDNLFDAFDWATTPQKYHYWSEINEDYAEENAEPEDFDGEWDIKASPAEEIDYKNPTYHQQQVIEFANELNVKIKVLK